MNKAWMSLAVAGLGWKLLAAPVTVAVVDETEGASVKNCAPDIVALCLAGESSLSAEYRRLTAEKYAVAKLPASAVLKQAILYRGSRWTEVASGAHQFGHADEGFSWAVLEEKSSGDKVLAFVVRAAADMAAADAVRQERLRQLHRAVNAMAQSHGAAIVGGGHFGPYGDSPAIRQLQAAGWLDAQQAEPTAEVTPTLTRVFFDPRRIESYEFRLGRPAAAKPETDLRPAIFTFRLHEERAWSPPVVGIRPAAAKWLQRIAAGEFDDVSPVGEVEYQPADEGTVIDIVVDTRAVLEALRYRRPELKVALRPLASKDAARAQAANAELVKYADGRRVLATGFAPSYPKTYARTDVSGSRGKWWWVDRLRANRDRIAREGGEYDVVMLGDSVTHFWHDFDYWTGARPVWERMQQEFRLLNLGYGGDNTRNLLWRLRHGELDGYRTKVFQLLIGANNYRDRPEVTAKEIGEIVQLLRERHPEAKIALMALLPRDDRPEFHALNLQVNERIKKYADDRTVFFLDIGQVFLGPDGHFKPGLSPDNDKLHLRGWGYELWWQQVAPTYRRWCSLLPGYEQAKIVCAKPSGWKFATTSREPEPGVVELDIELKSPVAAPPPAFDLEYELPGVGADHVWSAFDDRYMLYASGFDGRTRYTSQLAYQTPVLTVFGDEGSNVLAVACSEALRKVRFGVGISERTCTLQGTFQFFTEAEPATNAYRLSVRLDRRRNFWATAVTAASDWVMAVNGFQPCAVPEAAFDPLYSTWYAYWQDVDATELEREFPLAAALGMRTAILDDGWQKVQSASWYSATGDWLPVKSRFPDLKAHVAKAHAAGLKYMLWLSVPYVGDEAAAWKRFEGKFLRVKGTESPGRVGVLDPRFPEVREYLLQTYERVVRDWGFDGLKLDFIDQFVIEGEDPAAAEAYRGRDYRSLPEAVDRLMREVVARLTAIRPEVLIEFRQHYMGPAIRQYGNMIRATDSPADSDRIRKQIADLRLTSGTAAVHADMLVWHPEETPERAARPILNSLFSVIQYSMVLSRLPEAHRQVVRHWIEFTQRHREALVRGTFRPYHPELLYPRLEGESATEKVIALYSVAQPVAVDAAAKRTVLVNATFDPEIPVVAAGSARARVFDVIGREQGIVELAAGIQLLRIPVSGYAVFEVPGEVGRVPAFVSASAEEWERRERPQVLKTLLEEEYGVRPVERPADLAFAEIAPPEPAFGGQALRKRIRASYSGPGGSGHFDFSVWMPRRSQPVAVFVHSSPRPAETADDPAAERPIYMLPVSDIVSRGYAVIAYCNREVALDWQEATVATGGVFKVFGNAQLAKRRPTEWGILSAWAWGLSRIVDWIETEPALDARRVAVVGLSRNGKAALLAGATDPRFGLVVSCCSGCSGAKLNNMDNAGAETIRDIAIAKSWFAPNYMKYVDHDRDGTMPFDQHQLLALVAPRLLYVSSATEDAWAGPRGEFAAASLASGVWALYGRPGLVHQGFPRPDVSLAAGSIGYHLRTGPHAITREDWAHYLDFADGKGWNLPSAPPPRQSFVDRR